ncbi:MAG: hypothetical protein J6V41_05730 [Kiritimatiellae bacterium]|nr:hypothetical protein [Kiritimatiellia bacterium]
MKITSKIIMSFAIAVAFSSTLTAGVPVTRDTGSINYAINTADSSDFHFAIHAEKGTRNVETSAIGYDIDVARYVGVFGYDITRSLTLFVNLGAMNADRDIDADDDYSFTFGGGFMLNVFDSEQFDFLSTISRYRIQADAEIFYADFTGFHWWQMDASVTFQLHNEDGGNNHSILPEQYALFVGPCVSVISSDAFDYDSDNVFGFMVGVSLMFTENTYLTGGFEYYGDSEMYYGTLGVNF